MTKREVTAEEKAARKVKAAATHGEKMMARESGLTFGNIRCFQFDSDNVCLQVGDDDNGRRFYPDFTYAVLNVLDLKVTEKITKEGMNILAAIDAAKKEVLASLGAAGSTLRLAL